MTKESYTPHKQGSDIRRSTLLCRTHIPFLYSPEISLLRESGKICNFAKFLKHLQNVDTKYIFVTGGVVSSLGKGIISSSLACLLKARGFRVTIQKFVPNFTSGTTSASPTYVLPEQTMSPQDAYTKASSTRNVAGTIWEKQYRSFLI